MESDFHNQLVALLPALRRRALALTRNHADADDLVQDVVASALTGWNTFLPETDMGAWLHRILRNRFISDVRRNRTRADSFEQLSVELQKMSVAPHEAYLTLKDIGRAVQCLSAEQRSALLLVAMGFSYEAAAATSGCTVATAAGRVFRARRNLFAWLYGAEHPAPAPNRRAGNRESEVMA